MSKLDAGKIHSIMMDSLFKDDEVIGGKIPGSGVICPDFK